MEECASKVSDMLQVYIYGEGSRDAINTAQVEVGQGERRASYLHSSLY